MADQIIGIEEIKKVLPHREPMLLIDTVLEYEIGKCCKAQLHVHKDLDFFRGHFPGFPVMPGVLQLESLAQAGAFAVLKQDNMAGKIVLFAKADNVKFRRQVVPGDVMTLETEMERISRVGGKGRGVATVEGEVCCQGELTFVFAK